MTKCRHCGKPMEREYAGVGRKPVYCLREWCVRERERIIALEGYWRNRGKYEIYKVKVCPKCGEEFVTCKDNKIYCSDVCRKRFADMRKYYRERGELELFTAQMRARMNGYRVIYES